MGWGGDGGGAQWMITIGAADKTAAAFASVDRRLKTMEVTQRAAMAGINAGYGLITRALAPLAAALTATAIAQRVWNAGMEAANLGEQAEQIGLTTDALQAYRLAAAQNGVEAAQLDTAMMRLTKSMGEAAGGSDDAIARFEKLGVKLLDNQGGLRRTADILPEVARGLLEIGSQSERDALMMEIFARGGARMVTLLETLAGGQNSNVAAAREMAAVMGVDVIAAWDKVDDRLKVVNQQMTVFQATVGAPLALGGLTALEWTLRQIAEGYRLAKNGAIDFGLAIGTTVRGANIKTLEADVASLEKTITTRAGTLQATIDGMTSGAAGEMDDLARARLQSLRRDLAGVEPLKQQLAEKKALLDKAKADEADYRRGADENRVNRQLGIPLEPPPVTFRDFGLPGKQPLGKQAAAGGAKLDERLKDLQVERAALEKALAAFDVSGLETVAEVDRRLDAQVKLDQKIASLLKGVPPDSPLAQQFVQEATAIAQATARLDERKRIMTEAEQVTSQFGDGSRAAARATADLNAMLAAGAIDAGTYERALKAAKDAADDQARAYRGAQGGADGFIAGIEQGMADLERANSAFELGKQLVDELSDAFTDLAMGAEVDFNRILKSFLAMIIQMEMRAAASSLWNAVNGQNGSGGSMGGLGGLVVGALGSLFGGGVSSSAPLSFGVGGSGMAGAAALPGGWMPGFADGGRPPVGMPSIVGEEGPEVFWPDSAGTIIPNRALGGSGGETGDTVVVNQTMYFGSDVNQATLRTWAARIREETKLDILSQRRRGAKEWKGAFG